MTSNTKRLKLSPFPQATANRKPSAPKKIHPQNPATTQARIPALGALHLRPTIVTSNKKRGKNARSQFVMFNSSISSDPWRLSENGHFPQFLRHTQIIILEILPCIPVVIIFAFLDLGKNISFSDTSLGNV
jgi:hypothetical protein